MRQILVTYYSKSGNTVKVAQVLEEELTRLIQGKAIPDMGVVRKTVTDVLVQESMTLRGDIPNVES